MERTDRTVVATLRLSVETSTFQSWKLRVAATATTFPALQGWDFRQPPELRLNLTIPPLPSISCCTSNSTPTGTAVVPRTGMGPSGVRRIDRFGSRLSPDRVATRVRLGMDR